MDALPPALASASLSDPPEDAPECAICFELVPPDARLHLPCQCRLTYCLHCWDRALAASFNDSGRARCPSCRRPVRVDFDPEASDGRGRLRFSADGSEEGERAAVVNRLAEQAAPLMTRTLRQYGEEHPTLRAMARAPAEALLANHSVAELRRMLKELAPRSNEPLAEGVRVTLLGLKGRADLNGSSGTIVGFAQDRYAVRLTSGSDETVAVRRANLEEVDDGDGDGGVKAALVERLTAAAGSAAKLASYYTSVHTPAPHARCVCGGELLWTSGPARWRQLFASHLPNLRPEQLEAVLDAQLASVRAHCPPHDQLRRCPLRPENPRHTSPPPHPSPCTCTQPTGHARHDRVRLVRRPLVDYHARVLLRQRRLHHPAPHDLRHLRRVLRALLRRGPGRRGPRAGATVVPQAAGKPFESKAKRARVNLILRHFSRVVGWLVGWLLAC